MITILSRVFHELSRFDPQMWISLSITFKNLVRVYVTVKLGVSVELSKRLNNLDGIFYIYNNLFVLLWIYILLLIYLLKLKIKEN